MRSPVAWLERALSGHRRVAAAHTIKTTLAAVFAYLAARWLHTSPQPVLAPLTAILVVQLTMYETVASGLQRIVSVVAGVLVAVGVAGWIGLTWWSLGLVVGVSLVVGRLLRLGPQLLEVPISGMLVLAVGGADTVAADRVYETLLGTAVGVAVTAVIAPPLYLRPAGEAIADLAHQLADLLRGVGAQLDDEWSRAAADRWLAEARGLGRAVTRADASLGQAERGARLNPRAGLARETQPRLRGALTGLEHAQVAVRNLCRTLLDRAYYVPEDLPGAAYPPAARRAAREVLEAAAAAIDTVGEVAADGGNPDVARERLPGQLAQVRHLRDALAEALFVDPRADAAAWQQHGALLAAVDRLRVEIEAAVRPSEAGWRPSHLGDRQRRRRPRLAGRHRAALRRLDEWTLTTFNPAGPNPASNPVRLNPASNPARRPRRSRRTGEWSPDR